MMDNLSFDFNAPEPEPTRPTLQHHDGALQQHPEVMAIPPALDHHLYAFIAQAKCHGRTDPALSNFWVDGAGRSRYDEREVARFANELLCGVRSDRPSMTPERWSVAIQKAREPLLMRGNHEL